ncbi:phosphotriesterase [Paludibaculum fermentans]|uniref:phosphotriesterase family protein n=1 Tax=Paludibaculum fermentans TaxID=1473598 RepID=UPI003EB90F64
MRRREFLMGAMLGPSTPSVPNSILIHEHVLVDFIGAEKASPSRYDAEEVFRIARPKLEELKSFGCVRLHECTPNYLGRDARLCARLQEAAGIEIWTNTGIYGAANRSAVPEFARQESARDLAKRYVSEWKNGIGGLKPRFIKTAVNGFPLEPLDRKLVEAAAMASLETGLPIASHTNGGGPAAEAQLEILAGLHCPAAKFIWVHAHSEKDHKFHESVARTGAWVEFDGISESSAEWHRECVEWMQGRGALTQVLISQDAGWYHVGEKGGGTYRGYTYLYSGFLPLIPASYWGRLLVDNPRRAFA